jgi:hypothetical protein
MTALAARRATKSKYNAGDRYRDVPVASGETIFPGAIVAIVAGEAKAAADAGGGFIGGWADLDTTPEAGATPTTVNAHGTGIVRVMEGEAWWENGETIAASDVGAVGYAADDQTINTTAGTLQKAGTIVEVSATRGVLIHMGLAHSAAI